MAISKHEGVQLFPLQLTAASQLVENRAVKLSSANVPSYATYGEVAVGYVTQRGDENDYEVTVQPFDFLDRTFRLSLAGTVAANNPLFVTGAVGKVKTYTAIAGGATYTVKSRSVDVADADETLGNTYIVPSNSTQIATWNADADITGAVSGDVVYFDGTNWKCASDGTTAVTAGAATPTAGDVYWVEDEGIYVIWSGTAWLEAPVLAYAGEAGSSGEDIMCYRSKNMGQISVEQLDSGVRNAVQVIATGQTTAENDSDAEVVRHDDRITSSCWAICSIAAQAGTASIQKAVCTTDTLTVTLSGNGGAGTIINFMIMKLAS